MDTTNTVAAPALPGDVLEDILCRLPVPARSLMESRRVCKAWGDLVDDRQLLLPFPHKVTGLFVNYIDHYRPHFLARPAAGGGRRIDGEVSFIVREKPFIWHYILDHCNGLVLDSGDRYGEYGMYECNPTTRRWARLPPGPGGLQPKLPYHYPKHRSFLVFDPIASPAQWEVLVAPLETEMGWPPVMWRWTSLSSTAMESERKVFVREGEVPGTVALYWKDDPFEPRWRYGTYCQGALYVHCRGEYISRLSLSTKKYRVIKSPIDLAECKEGTMSSIGKSGNRVCFAALDKMSRLRVWTLNETEWLLKHHTVVFHPDYKEIGCSDAPWTIDKAKEYRDSETEDDDEEVSQEDNWDWNSDDDDIIDTAEEYDYGLGRRVKFLGFHLYKEVIFLRNVGTYYSAVALHLNGTKVQYLGNLHPGCYNRDLFDSFVYTPCLFGV